MRSLMLSCPKTNLPEPALEAPMWYVCMYYNAAYFAGSNPLNDAKFKNNAELMSNESYYLIPEFIDSMNKLEEEILENEKTSE